ncbi:hypothetical protein [Colwellia psychrerythraea]|uniref:Porin domain-containing protein n=1 Tax=Colwellia psychrerythraea TaxID=28229 RepID=A0A099L232_COLPS|nr:hypothetical protein [Colwellia psychrerythraea]KGJ96177.1 hypothetical protein GAB14E_0124 [Colwellia psychrerythraea]
MKSLIFNLLITFLLLFFAVISMPCYANLTENFRWSLDGSARLNQNAALDNTSRIYALGLDTHKVFTNSNGDIGYGVGQLYWTKLSNHMPVPFLFTNKDDSEFIIREAHLNYTAGPDWLPNIRVGHFTLPFGLEESIDTNGRLLDYYLGKNLGSKLDWGLSLNKVINKIEYNVSYTLGGKDKAKSVDGSYAITGRVGSLSHLDFVIGLSIFDGEIDGYSRKRLALDWQYYWTTWGLLGELALGEDDKQNQSWQKEKYGLIELNKTAINEQLKLYSQLIIRDRESQNSADKLVNIGFSYQFNTQLELSMSGGQQINNPASGKKQQLARVQVRYRY